MRFYSDLIGYIDVPEAPRAEPRQLPPGEVITPEGQPPRHLRQKMYGNRLEDNCTAILPLTECERCGSLVAGGTIGTHPCEPDADAREGIMRFVDLDGRRLDMYTAGSCDFSTAQANLSRNAGDKVTG